MKKELQDHVWKHCLPKEFKEEVKIIFSEYSNTKFSVVRSELMNIFGFDNLTSDAEGEENNIDLSKLNKKLDAALNSETKKSLEEWMEDDDSNTRLQIAAQLLSGLLASGKEKHPVRRAIELTDALMEELEKKKSV